MSHLNSPDSHRLTLYVRHLWEFNRSSLKALAAKCDPPMKLQSLWRYIREESPDPWPSDVADVVLNAHITLQHSTSFRHSGPPGVCTVQEEFRRLLFEGEYGA